MGNWKNWCRLCGDSENATHTSLDTVGADGLSILDNISQCMVLELNDNTELPQSICKPCDKQLSSICRFWGKCVKVQKMFEELLSNNMSSVDSVRSSYIKEQQFSEDESQHYEPVEDDEEEEEIKENIETQRNTRSSRSKRKSSEKKIKTNKKGTKIRLKTTTTKGVKKKKEAKKSKSKKRKGRKSKGAESGDDSFPEDDISNYGSEANDFYNDPDYKTNDPDFKAYADTIGGDSENVPPIKIKKEIKKEKIVNGETKARAKRRSGELIPPLGKYDCHTCDASFKTWTHLSHHCTQIHKLAAFIMCPGCATKLTSRVMVSRHRAIHSGIPVEYFSCDKCSKQFLRKSLLQDHILSHVPKEEQPFVCCKCARRFHSEALLRHHERVHLPPEERSTFPCPQCDKKFSSRSAVTAHMKAVHLGERPFVCHECGQSFASKGILQEHLTIHSDDAPWKCDVCAKKFKTKYRLKLHLDTHGDTPYACPHCPMKLNTRRTLRMHLVVHRDTKAYQCQTCGKSFRRSKDLKNHNNLHSGKRPYTCPWCNRTFANGSNCRSHKRRMHPEELKLYESTMGIVHKEKKPKIKIDVPPVLMDEGGGDERSTAPSHSNNLSTNEHSNISNSNHSIILNPGMTSSRLRSVEEEEEEALDKNNTGLLHQEDKINQQLLKLTRIYNQHHQQQQHVPPTSSQQNYYQQFNFQMPESSPHHFYDQHAADNQEFPATIPAFPGNPYIHNLMYNRSNAHNM